MRKGCMHHAEVAEGGACVTRGKQRWQSVSYWCLVVWRTMRSGRSGEARTQDATNANRIQVQVVALVWCGA